MAGRPIPLHRLTLVTVVMLAAGWLPLGAQRGASSPESSPTPREAAPIDLTGYWVSIVTEDWRWRMVTPKRGDYASVPITPAAKAVADQWDPARDEAAGEQCRSYGAAAIMRVPGRLHITWQDDRTLKVETDAGMQTRWLRFADPDAAGGEATWQGQSAAEWDAPRGQGGGRDGEARARPGYGSLKVVTTRMRPGYLRKNGIPYSADAVMTEYWDVYDHPRGERWLVITTLVDDPVYLERQYVTSPNFKQEPDGGKWDPVPCSARW